MEQCGLKQWRLNDWRATGMVGEGAFKVRTSQLLTFRLAPFSSASCTQLSALTPKGARKRTLAFTNTSKKRLMQEASLEGWWMWIPCAFLVLPVLLVLPVPLSPLFSSAERKLLRHPSPPLHFLTWRIGGPPRALSHTLSTHYLSLSLSLLYSCDRELMRHISRRCGPPALAPLF